MQTHVRAHPQSKPFVHRHIFDLNTIYRKWDIFSRSYIVNGVFCGCKDIISFVCDHIDHIETIEIGIQFTAISQCLFQPIIGGQPNNIFSSTTILLTLSCG